MDHTFRTAKSWLQTLLANSSHLQRNVIATKEMIANLPSVTQEQMNELDRLYTNFGKLVGDDSPLKQDLYQDLIELAKRSGLQIEELAEVEAGAQ